MSRTFRVFSAIFSGIVVTSPVCGCQAQDDEGEGKEVQLDAGCAELIQKTTSDMCEKGVELAEKRLVCPLLDVHFSTCELLCADGFCPTSIQAPQPNMEGEYVRVGTDSEQDGTSFWLTDQDFQLITYRPSLQTFGGQGWKFPATVFGDDGGVTVYLAYQPDDGGCTYSYTVMHAANANCADLRGTIRTLSVNICADKDHGTLTTYDWFCQES